MWGGGLVVVDGGCVWWLVVCSKMEWVAVAMLWGGLGSGAWQGESSDHGRREVNNIYYLLILLILFDFFSKSQNFL